MNKKILKKALCLILVMSSITTWAQNSNKDIFYRNDLLGKKWVMYLFLTLIPSQLLSF